MSRPGTCWDKAPMESVFATLKVELAMTVFPTRAAARSAVLTLSNGSIIGSGGIRRWPMQAQQHSNSAGTHDRWPHEPVSTELGQYQVRFSAGSTSVELTIDEDNPAVRDFLSMLPRTLTLEEFGGRWRPVPVVG